MFICDDEEFFPKSKDVRNHITYKIKLDLKHYYYEGVHCPHAQTIAWITDELIKQVSSLSLSFDKFM